MKIEGDFFYITPAEVEAGQKVTKGSDWDAACNYASWQKRAGEELHFKLPGLLMPEYINSLRATAALPESDRQTCFTGTGESLIARQIAIDILLALEIDLVTAH